MAPSKNLALLKKMSKPQALSVMSKDLDRVEAGQVTPPIVDLAGDEGSTPQNQSAPRSTAARETPFDKTAAASLKRKPDPPADAARESKKMKKKEKQSKHKSAPIPVDEEFFAKNIEAYKTDPFNAAAALFKRVADVKEFEMGEVKRKVQAELVETNGKLEHTQKLLNERSQQFKGAQEEIKILTTARDLFRTRAEESAGQVKELAADKEKLQKQLEERDAKIEELENKLARVSSEDSAAARIAELEKQLAQSEDDRITAATLGLTIATEGFQNAIEQIELVHPDFSYDRKFIRSDCWVEENKIVFEDTESGEKVQIFPTDD